VGTLRSSCVADSAASKTGRARRRFQEPAELKTVAASDLALRFPGLPRCRHPKSPLALSEICDRRLLRGEGTVFRVLPAFGEAVNTIR